MLWDGEGDLVGDGVSAPGGAVETPAEPAAVEPSGGNPWDNDLRSALEGAEDPFAAASKYIGDTFQPRMTQLEQQLAERSEVPEAITNLYKDLTEDPDAVIRTMVEARYGEEVVQKFQGLFDFPADPDDLNVDPDVDAPPESQNLTPEQQKALEYAQQKQQQEQYQELLNDVKALPGRENLDEVKFSEKLWLADGNVEQALASMDAEKAQYEKAFREQFNIPDEQPVPEPAPQTLDSQVQTPAQAEPPKTYDSWDQLDEAFDDMAAETRQQAPPAVGSA